MIKGFLLYSTQMCIKLELNSVVAVTTLLFKRLGCKPKFCKSVFILENPDSVFDVRTIRTKYFLHNIVTLCTVRVLLLTCHRVIYI